MKPSMFPSGNSAETGNQELKKTRRFLPHLMNTGGFFVAILQKKQELPKAAERHRRQAEWEAKMLETERAKAAEKAEKAAAAAKTDSVVPEEDVGAEGAAGVAADHADHAVAAEEDGAPAADAVAAEEDGAPAAKRVKKDTSSSPEVGPSENPPNAPKDADRFLPIPDSDWEQLEEYFGFPKTARPLLFKRPFVNGDNKIYGVSEKMQEVISCCQSTGSTKIIACGVRTFQELGSFGGKCQWRVTQDGLNFALALGLGDKKILKIKPALLTELLQNREVKTALVVDRRKEFFVDTRKSASGVEGKEDSECGKFCTKFTSDGKMEFVEQGSYVLWEKESDVYATVLVSRNNFTLYVDKQEAKALGQCLTVGEDLRKAMGI